MSPSGDYQNVLLMSYYRNNLIHIFINESFITCSLYAFGEKCAHKEGVSREDLFVSSATLSALLKKEFLLEKTLEDRVYFDQLIDKLCDKQILECIENGNVRVASETGERAFTFLCSLIWPLIDTYWVTFVYIFSLVPSKFVGEVDMANKIQWFADNLIKDKILEYYESCSQETIRNAIGIFLDFHIITHKNLETVTSGVKDSKVITLTQEFNDETSL